MPQQRVTVWQGAADCDLSVPDDVWEDVSLTFSAYLFRRADFDLSAVYAYFANAKTLAFTRLPGFHYRVRSVSGIKPRVQYDGARIGLSITVSCEPFRYLDDNPELAVTSGTVTNPGTRYARPVWHVTGAASAVLTVNGEALTVTGAPSAEYYIDTERMLVYAPDGTNILPYTVGLLPFLQPGENNVSLSAGTLKVRVNGRCW
jgi:phage-related protein